MDPTLSGYSTFLFSVVNVNSAALPPLSSTGTLVAGSSVLTLATVSVGWLEENAILSDADGSIQFGTTAGEQLTGNVPGNIGTYQMSLPALTTVSVPEAITATNPWIVSTFCTALDVVNCAIKQASARRYLEAVYNLATDLLINIATDQPNQTYFKDMRAGYRIAAPSFGVPASASDQGTSGSLVTPEFMRNLTNDDLQRMKTPFGRRYIGIAQDYAPSIWGLT